MNKKKTAANYAGVSKDNVLSSPKFSFRSHVGTCLLLAHNEMDASLVTYNWDKDLPLFIHKSKTSHPVRLVIPLPSIHINENQVLLNYAYLCGLNAKIIHWISVEPVSEEATALKRGRDDGVVYSSSENYVFGTYTLNIEGGFYPQGQLLLIVDLGRDHGEAELLAISLRDSLGEELGALGRMPRNETQVTEPLKIDLAPKYVKSSTAEIRTENTLHVNSAIEGYVEHLSPLMISGWARQVDNIEPVTVQIILDGLIIGQVIADVGRMDLKEAGFGYGAHAFSFYFPNEIRDYFKPGLLLAKIVGSEHILSHTKALSDLLLELGSAGGQGKTDNDLIDKVLPDQYNLPSATFLSSAGDLMLGETPDRLLLPREEISSPLLTLAGHLAAPLETEMARQSAGSIDIQQNIDVIVSFLKTLKESIGAHHGDEVSRLIQFQELCNEDWQRRQAELLLDMDKLRQALDEAQLELNTLRPQAKH